MDLLSDSFDLGLVGKFLGFPFLPELTIEPVGFLLKHSELMPGSSDVFVLLTLTELIEQLLIRF